MSYLTIFKTKYWEIGLNQDQAYLGRCYIFLNRECGDLADLKEEEIIDFLHVIKKIEEAIRGAFGATMFNWTCLMNDDYKYEDPKPQVHWHIRPRYKNKVKFEGVTFEDPEFAYHYDRNRHFGVREEVLKKIVKKIQENLK